MIRWYQESRVCIAFLEDVVFGTEVERSFADCVWFTRSWTLQELLASENVDFFDRHWKYIGNKESNSEWIGSTTGILTTVLQGERPIFDCVIAERICWASRRVATRLEEVAYSLTGIFDVNMPPLYSGTCRFQTMAPRQ
jgi:hypothetical protein